MNGYAMAALTSLQQKDYAAADLYFHRMALLDHEDPEVVYGMALAAAGSGDLDRTRSLMRQIAPDTAAGYPPPFLAGQGHARPRQAALAPGIPRRRAAFLHALAETNRHYLHVLGESKENIEAHALLGYLYWSRAGTERAAGQTADSARDTKQAIAHMEEAVKEQPELMASLAVMYAGQKDDWAAKNAAVKARDYFAQKTEAEPAVLANRLQWGLTEALVAELPAGRNRPRTRPGLSTSRAISRRPGRRLHHLVRRHARHWRRAGQTHGLLKSALDHGPGNPQVLATLAELSTQDSPNADAARGAGEGARPGQGPGRRACDPGHQGLAEGRHRVGPHAFWNSPTRPIRGCRAY